MMFAIVPERDLSRKDRKRGQGEREADCVFISVKIPFIRVHPYSSYIYA